jgi:hypothetical protein
VLVIFSSVIILVPSLHVNIAVNISIIMELCDKEKYMIEKKHHRKKIFIVRSIAEDLLLLRISNAMSFCTIA